MADGLVLVLVLGFVGHFEDDDEDEEEAAASPGFNHTPKLNPGAQRVVFLQRLARMLTRDT